MVFSSPLFLFLFLPIVLLLYFSVPFRFKNGVLLLSSLLFYAWGETTYVTIMLASILINYLTALMTDSPKRCGSRKRCLVLGIAANLALLGTFKYAGFLTENLNLILPMLGRPPLDVPEIHLPLGISFFTFQAISYLMDVYRKEVPPQKNIFNVALYISMFPQLIAGPIVRYRDVARKIRHREHSMAQTADGISIFIVGLSKKMLLANPVGQAADKIFALPPTELSWSLAWCGALCYSLQIFYDFSGYSDMAIGLGRILGFDFPQNFNFPYIATSIREFWRRWHISLSTWFRDYLYFPLGGGRTSPWKVYRNLFLVFLLCGLWHGANWTFVIWGLMHGAFIILERAGLANLLKKLWRPLQRCYTLLIVLVAWVFFRSETLGAAWNYIGAMFGWIRPALDYPFALLVSNEAWVSLCAGLLFSMPLGWKFKRSGISVALLFILLVLSVLNVSSDTYNPFIYFRF